MQYLRVRDVVQKLGGTVSAKTVYTLCYRGILKSCKLGGVLLVHADSLDAILAGRSPGAEVPKDNGGEGKDNAPSRPARKGRGKGQKIPVQDLW